jgi:hypothetical protein
MSVAIVTPPRNLVTNWLLALSRLNLPAGQTCGDSRAEVNTSGVLVYPYHVIYPIAGGQVTGPALGASQADAVFVYQVDSVGRTRDQAEKAADRIRNWIVGRTAAGVFVVQAADPDGLQISDRIVDGTPGAPLQEGQPPNEVFTVSDTIGIHVTVK